MKKNFKQYRIIYHILITIILYSFIITLYMLPKAAFGDEHIPDEHTLILLHFNGILNGADGETPTQATGVTFEEGIFDTGAYFPVGNQLFYESLNNIDSTEGTLEFWIKPRWNGYDSGSNNILRMGLWGGMVFHRSYDNLRFILNRWTDESWIIASIGNWLADQWHHVAFTWNSHKLRIFIDGILKAEKDVTKDLPIVDETDFQIGADWNNYYEPLDAVLDELRISNIARSEDEIESSFLAGIITVYELEINPSPINLLETWWKTPELVATTDFGTINIPPASATWSTSNSSVASVNQEGFIVAISEGTANISASYKGALAEVVVNVAAPVLDPEIEAIDPYLATPAEGYLYEIPVVIIRYLPTRDGIHLDETPTGYPSTLEDLKTRIDTYEKRIKFMLEEGSRYHGYNNSNTVPSLGYRIIHIVTVYEEVQLGFPVPWRPGWYRPDYNQILTRFNAEAFVNDLGVKEFWLWTWHYGGLEPAESNMSSPITGDISNSERYQDDLPIYNQTYVVYNYNFTRTQSEAVHNHGHQLEAILSYVNQRQDGNKDLFWKKFVGQDDTGNFITGRCGWTHMPPNTTDHYDYVNPSLVESDIENWRPDGTGDKKPVNVDTWGNLVFQWPEGETDFHQRVEAQWYIYWMQNMPGHHNCIEYGENYMTNWWLFTADWDLAILSKGLYSAVNSCPSAPTIPAGVLLLLLGE